MSHLIWLVLMASCAWTAGRIVGGKGRGAVADILFGITGALAVRFVLDALRATVQDIDAFLFSVWGAAGLAGIARFLMKRHDGRVSAFSRNAAPLTTRVPDTYVSHPNGNDASTAN
jgi:uncharacterized membrane protein YeaQ/YmgE (transglycosylase-associated protein family)